MENYRFYKNKRSGEVLILLSNKEVDYEIFEEITANSVDAAFEKHVPAYEVFDDYMAVKVGDVAHPMDENHYIMWIAVINENNLEVVKLKPGDAPEANFKYVKGAKIYAYCNLHGLWKSEV